MDGSTFLGSCNELVIQVSCGLEIARNTIVYVGYTQIFLMTEILRLSKEVVSKLQPSARFLAIRELFSDQEEV